jgi:hypothetical protein
MLHTFLDFQILLYLKMDLAYTGRSKGSRTDFYRSPTYAFYRSAIELRSWRCFSQECKLALV